MSRRRIVLLCGRGYSSDVVYAALGTLDADVEVILEEAPSRWPGLRRRVARHGLPRALGQLAFRSLLVPWLRFTTRSRIDEIRRRLPSAVPVESGDLHHVPSANTAEAQRLLEQLRPDLVVVNGTRILSERTLSATDAPIINMHAGITPLYRGVHGGYWALVEGRPDLFGATVHRVDPGVDTGEVLGRAFAVPEGRDTFASYAYLQLEAGLPVLLRVAEAELGLREAERVESFQLASSQRYHPTIWEYLRARIRRKVR